jgi:hypothetical protein
MIAQIAAGSKRGRHAKDHPMGKNVAHRQREP